MTSYGPFFLAGVVCTITLAGHEPWDHHAPHEQAPEQEVVSTTPITTPTSGSFFFSTVLEVGGSTPLGSTDFIRVVGRRVCTETN